jgi:WD40 repeat protein
MWDTRTGTSLGDFPRHAHSCTSLSFDASGSRILTSSKDGTVRIWEPQLTPYVSRSISLTSSAAVPTDNRFSGDGRRFARPTAGGYGLEVIDTATKQPVFEPLNRPHPGKHVWGLEKNRERVFPVALSPDGRRVAFGISSTGTLAVWEIDSRTCVFARGGLYFGALHSLRFSDDGKVLVTSSSDNKARVWDATTGEPKGPPLPVFFHTSCTLAPDNRRVIAVDADSPPQPIQLFDGWTGDRLLELPPLTASDLKQHPSATGIPVAWFTPEGIALGIRTRHASPGDMEPGNTMAVSEYRLHNVRTPAKHSAYVAGLLTGRRLDDTDGIQFLLPYTFKENAEPYRDAWRTWRNDRSDALRSR